MRANERVVGELSVRNAVSYATGTGRAGRVRNRAERAPNETHGAFDLYDTGIYDAMYLAGLIADDSK